MNEHQADPRQYKHMTISTGGRLACGLFLSDLYDKGERAPDWRQQFAMLATLKLDDVTCPRCIGRFRHIKIRITSPWPNLRLRVFCPMCGPVGSGPSFKTLRGAFRAAWGHMQAHKITPEGRTLREDSKPEWQFLVKGLPARPGKS